MAGLSAERRERRKAWGGAKRSPRNQLNKWQSAERAAEQPFAACHLNQESDSSFWSRLQHSLASKNDSRASASLQPISLNLVAPSALKTAAKLS